MFKIHPVVITDRYSYLPILTIYGFTHSDIFMFIMLSAVYRVLYTIICILGAVLIECIG